MPGMTSAVKTPLSESVQEEKVEYRLEPHLGTSGHFEYAESTKAAIIKYRELCRHIAKSILQAEQYLPIQYNIEEEALIAYLQTNNGPITRINVTNVLEHLDGRFDTVLEGIPEFNDDGTTFIKIQKALTSQQGSIFTTSLYQKDSLSEQFLTFTSKFWFSGPYHEFCGFLWSDPKLVQYITRPNNFSLFIIMSLALTKYLMVTKTKRQQNNIRYGKAALQAELLQRAECEYNMGYKKGLIIDSKFPKSFSRQLPYKFGGAVARRFARCEYLIILDEHNQNDYFGGAIISDSNEQEVMLESSVIIEVLDVQVKPAFHKKQHKVGKETYTEVRIAVRKKPQLTVPDDFSVNPAVMSLFSETLDSLPSITKRVIPAKTPACYQYLSITENKPAATSVVEVTSVPLTVDKPLKQPELLPPVSFWKQNPNPEVKSVFDNTDDFIFARNIISIIEEQRKSPESIILVGNQGALVQKMLLGICTAIAKDPNPIECGNRHCLLLEQLLKIILDVKGLPAYADSLNSLEVHQALNLANGVQMKSFTPVQLLVVLQHKKALSHLADAKLLHWKAIVPFNTLAGETKDENKKTLPDFAKAVGFKEFSKFYQLCRAKDHLKEIEAEKAWFDSGGKQSRINACNALIQYCQEGTPIAEQHLSALSKSTLRDLVALNPVVYAGSGLTKAVCCGAASMYFF